MQTEGHINGAMIHKNDYKVIAKAVLSIKDLNARSEVCLEMAKVLAEDSPAFSYMKWKAACQAEDVEE